MQPNLIVGFDGSAAGTAALDWALDLGSALGADAVAVHVHPPPVEPYPDAYLGVPPETVQEIHRAAELEAAEILARAHGVVERIPVMDPSPSIAIAALAEQRKSLLVVLGATHRGRFGRVLPGSVGERLANEAPCPVAVVPAGWRPVPLTRIVVGYDGHADARRALRLGAALAARTGARLEVAGAVFGVPTDPGLEADPEALDRALGAPFRPLLEEAVARVSDRVDASVRLLSGRPGPALQALCAGGADLLVVGSRGLGRVRGAALGSVSRRLVDEPPCPVIVTGPRVGVRPLRALERQEETA